MLTNPAHGKKRQNGALTAAGRKAELCYYPDYIFRKVRNVDLVGFRRFVVQPTGLWFGEGGHQIKVIGF